MCQLLGLSRSSYSCGESNLSDSSLAFGAIRDVANISDLYRKSKIAKKGLAKLVQNAAKALAAWSSGYLVCLRSYGS
jgi:hypothetical protein